MMADVLRIGLANVDFRLPTQVTDDNSVVALKSLVFEPLVRWQPQGLVKPGLFSHWEHSPDGRIWHFHIRDEAVFHDGLPCTAQVVATYIHGFVDSLDYFGMQWSSRRYFARATFTAEDDRTVQVESPEPFADILDIFCDFWPSRIAADGKPVLGTGPFRVAVFEREAGIGRAVLHRAHPGRSDRPHVIIATAEREGERRLRLLRAGEVDVALNLERVEDLELVDFDPSLRWGKIASTLSVMYYLNCPRGIFSSPDARLAANLAVDSAALVKEVYHGLATASTTIVSPFHLGSAEANLKPIPYNPARVRELLKGFDLSAPITLRTPVYMPEHVQKISHFVASSLEAVGFKVNIDLETNRPEYARSIGFRKLIGDLALFDSTPNSTFRVLDDKIPSANNATWWLGYHDDGVQELIQYARRKITEEDRAKDYGRCLKRLQENPPWLYMAHPDVIWANRPDVALSIGHSGVPRLG